MIKRIVDNIAQSPEAVCIDSSLVDFPEHKAGDILKLTRCCECIVTKLRAS